MTTAEFKRICEIARTTKTKAAALVLLQAYADGGFMHMAVDHCLLLDHWPKKVPNGFRRTPWFTIERTTN